MKRVALVPAGLLLLLACCVMAHANPIPVPTLTLEEEYVEIRICRVQEGARVDVVGVYPFSNVGFERIVMYFPIPPSVYEESIEVLVDGREVRWEIVEKAEIQVPGGGTTELVYETAIGRYSFLKWFVEGPGEEFVVEVHYSHPAEEIDEGYRALYAMATGRFYYSKRCTAHVRIVLEGFGGARAVMSLVPPPESVIGATSIELRLDSEEEVVELEETSRMFTGLDRDLLLEIHTAEGEGEGGERWALADPARVGASLNLSASDGMLKIGVELVYPHAGFKEIWSEPRVEDGEIVLDVEVYEWTGPAAQVVTHRTRSFELEVGAGAYEVVVRVNGVVKAESGIYIGKAESGPGLPVLLFLCLPILAIGVLIAYTIGRSLSRSQPR